MKLSFSQSFLGHFTGGIVGSGIMVIIVKNVPIDDMPPGTKILVLILLYVFLIITSLLHAATHSRDD